MGKPKVPKKGAPAWMATFADMMSLLLTFFVLLLSMSEIDATRFRKVSGELKKAFGVQRKDIFDEPPKGSSFIQQEHSAGGSRSPMSIGGATANIIDPQLQAIKNKMEKQDRQAEIQKQKEMETNFKKVYAKFEKEIRESSIQLEQKGNDLILRIPESEAFPEKRTQLTNSFKGMLEKLSDLANDIDKTQLVISGHSDDKDVKTGKFKSNWEFSAARANTLAQALMQKGDVEPERITVEFHGPTQPLVRNNSSMNRKRNRRIEFIIRH